MRIFDEKIVGLIRLYLSGAISEEEWQELKRWISENERNSQFFEDMKQEGRFAKDFPEFCEIDMERGWKRFEQRVQQGSSRSWRSVLKYAAAIVIPITVGLSVWLWYQEEHVVVRPLTQEIEPGQVKATLILPEGTVIALDEKKLEEIEVDKGLKAKRTQEGLVYNNPSAVKDKEIKFNTLKIPRGGEFHLTLADGTSIMLNSATSLKYPVMFGQRDRKVYLDGEGFFEVKTDSTRPFIVEMEGMQVRVYGTSFNVNTHRVEDIQTVLVEGKVGIKLSDSDKEYVLNPGELARFNREDKSLEIQSVDARQYTAWTRGIFTFEEETLERIMNILSLWYDVDVFYQAEGVKQLHFSGHLERYKEIRNILGAITEATGVIFTVKERTIIVSQ